MESPLLKRIKLSNDGKDAAKSSKTREICTYGSNCYRRNIHHLLEYAHPQLEEVFAVMKSCGNFEDMPPDTTVPDTKIFLEQIKILKQAKFVNNTNVDSADDIDGKTEIPVVHTTTTKKQSERAENMTVLQKWEKTIPFNYFLTKVSRISEEKENVFSVSFGDLLDKSFGKIKSICHINFMIEANWFIEESLKAGVEGVPTWILCGVESLELQEAASTFPWLKLFGIKSPFPYGHHHTKMSIVQYADLSVRFMVYTANLIDTDWENRTQGVWISPKCPKQESREGGDSVTKFKADMIQYLQSYPVRVTGAWVDVIRHIDCSSIKVYFIASAPITAQSPTNGFQWGIKKMERVIKSLNANTVDLDWPLIVQCSSIGSLGNSQLDWLQSELGKSMAGGGRLEGPVHVIYPSHTNVRDSFDGVQGGGCLPYTGSTHMKQTWLEKHLCQWKANCSGRSRAVPHIKSYCRISPDSSKIAWFLVTSANLSKAAWGKLNKKKDRLSVMSWEAGVLFDPQLLIEKPEFSVGAGDGKDTSSFPVHIDFPVTKYRQEDKPWFIDTLASM